MRAAFSHLAKALGKGDLKKGYMLFFKSTPISNASDDNETIIRQQLEEMLKEVQAFESEVLIKWGDH